MTGLDRRVKRETSTIDHTRGGRRPLVVMLEEGGKLLRIKPKGTRKWYAVDYASIYRMAVMAEARAIVAAKKAARAEKRLTRA